MDIAEIVYQIVHFVIILTLQLDIFNVRCDIDKLIPQIELILRIKYNLKIIDFTKLKVINYN